MRREQLGSGQLAVRSDEKTELIVFSLFRSPATATLKITGHLQKSTEIMKLSNELVRLPQLQATMRNMSMDMTKVCLYSPELASNYPI